MKSLKNPVKQKRLRLAGGMARTIAAFDRLESFIAAVKGREEDSPIGRVMAVLRTMSRKEAIPIAIIGGLGAIYHGYERNTKDVDIVIAVKHLDSVIRLAPKYGIKVIWHAPDGWHKLGYEGMTIDVVPEGGTPRKDAPTTIPSPKQLGVPEGLDYAVLPGWIETKVSSNRSQDRADVVQVIKRTPANALAGVRRHLEKVHLLYVRRFAELLQMAQEELEQEEKRGGRR